jgi:hypothetical protein
MRFLEGRAHLVRVGFLFLAGLVVFLVLRGLFVPADFGVYGHYRAGALEDNRKPAVVHAGQAACVECHTDTDEARRPGRHARISCEACHGAQARHAGAPDQVKPERPPGRNVCLPCHSANVARPATFPQVDVEEHAGDAACVACHLPHQPGAAPEAQR